MRGHDSQYRFRLEVRCVDNSRNYIGSVLVADDDPAFRGAFSNMLEIKGYRTTAAEKSNEIFKLVADHEFDLLTLDLDWETEYFGQRMHGHI